MRENIFILINEIYGRDFLIKMQFRPRRASGERGWDGMEGKSPRRYAKPNYSYFEVIAGRAYCELSRENISIVSKARRKQTMWRGVKLSTTSKHWQALWLPIEFPLRSADFAIWVCHDLFGYSGSWTLVKPARLVYPLCKGEEKLIYEFLIGKQKASCLGKRSSSPFLRFIISFLSTEAEASMSCCRMSNWLSSLCFVIQDENGGFLSSFQQASSAQHLKSRANSPNNFSRFLLEERSERRLEMCNMGKICVWRDWQNKQHRWR